MRYKNSKNKATPLMTCAGQIRRSDIKVSSGIRSLLSIYYLSQSRTYRYFLVEAPVESVERLVVTL